MSAPIKEPGYFGGCPHCGGDDGYLNIGRDHWFVCDTHKTRWCAGANLFSSWQEEAQSDWDAATRKLENYVEVKPIYTVSQEMSERENAPPDEDGRGVDALGHQEVQQQSRSKDSTQGLYQVIVTRHRDRNRSLYGRYTELERAKSVAATLRRYGIIAEVVEPLTPDERVQF